MASLHMPTGATALPLDLLLSTIPSLPRAMLDRLVERAIDRLDQLDGDNDIEANGDELDGTGGEDDFIDHYGNNMGGNWYGAGCPISDPDLAVDDEGEEGCDDEGIDDSEDDEPSRQPSDARKSREAHCRRIQRTRCEAHPRNALGRTYRLLD